MLGNKVFNKYLLLISIKRFFYLEMIFVDLTIEVKLDENR